MSLIAMFTFFFFSSRRRHTRLQGDWSSDVCSSDLGLYYREPIRRTAVASASYVTGSHAFKAGIQYGWGYFWRQRAEVADLIQLYRRSEERRVGKECRSRWSPYH